MEWIEIENKIEISRKNIEMKDLFKGSYNYFELHRKYLEGIE